jgi:hypothetical protein
MEGSEKDAARSKWKLTQRHKRGRGRERGAFGGRSSAGAADRRLGLGSNQERYEEADGAAPCDGPVRKSQGADLAELLAQSGSYDARFYAHQRVSLVEQTGLPPPDAAGYPGLTFDLKGLEACLAALPLHQVLRLGAPVDVDADAQRREPVEQAEPALQVASQQKPARGAGHPQHPAALSAPVAASPSGDQLDGLLAEPVAAQRGLPATPATEDSGGGRGVDAVDDDLELDRLLGLARPTAAKAPPQDEAAGSGDAFKGESLEEWLDAL